MTLKGHYALCFKTRASFGAHHENLNEDRLYFHWRRCSPMTLDSDNIRFMRIFAGVPWKGGVIQQWGNHFLRFRTLRIRHLRRWGQHYYIVLFSPLSPLRWPQNTWPWMTLNGLMSHSTSYVHYYELPLTHYLLLIYCSLFITLVTKGCDQRRSAGSGIAKSVPQNIGIQGKSADLPWTLYCRNLNK